MRKCKHCSKEIPLAAKSTTIYHKAKFCSYECMAQWGLAEAKKAKEKKVKQEAKKKKQEFKEMKDRVDSQGQRSKAMQAAQRAFNAYIRERDKEEPCISCGATKVKFGGYKGASGWDAGHYRSRGACPELRFHEDNCFKQCVHCNRDKSGNVVEMRLGILRRIGQERLDWIEGPHEPKNYSLEELKEIAATYRAKLKELSN